MSCSAILLCAGRGERIGAGIDKAFVTLHGKYLLWYSLIELLKVRGISQIIIVARKEFFSRIKALDEYDQRCFLVEGGKARSDSVKRGLAKVDPKNRYVLIHDSARPFITADLIKRLLRQVTKGDSVIPVLAVRDTIKKVQRSFVTSTLPREKLYVVQTPQVFPRQVIQQAHRECTLTKIYDDAQVVEALGFAVKVCPGSAFNFKITYPEDLVIADALMRAFKT